MRLYLALIISSVYFLPGLCWGFSSCKISLNTTHKESKVEGTGYKFTEKKGVTAHFKKFLVQQRTASSVKDLLSGLKVEVDLKSVDSGNSARDQNLRDSLFKNLKDDGKAFVKVLKVDGETLKTELKLNGVTKKVDFDWKRDGDALTAQAQVDVLDYSMSPSIELLKSLCNKLHVGSDGVSKTWSDFNLKVTGLLLEKGCG